MLAPLRAALLVAWACASVEARALVAAGTAPRGRPRTDSAGRDAAFRRETDFAKSAISGGAAAAAATVAFHPVDTMKTVLQRGGSGGGWSAVRGLGASGLYRGVLPAAFSMMPACAVRMGAYEALKGSLLARAPGGMPPGALVFCASAMSVVVSSSVRAPLDMIKTRVQADSTISALGAIRTSWQSGGIRGMYRGVGLSLARDVPFFGCNLLIYEQLKAAATARAVERAAATRAASPRSRANPSDSEPMALRPLELILIGFASQGIAGWLTNPADVLKTRVQAGAAAGIGAALAGALRDGGPMALMRGAGMRVVWIAPQGCVYYPAYEAMQRLLSRSATE
jgi:hypothetical protein